MYSQRDEEAFILKLIGNPLPSAGRYLDVGAFDAVLFSNTRALATQGWSGTLVEPSPIVWELLNANARGYDAHCIPCAIVDRPQVDDTITLYESQGDSVSTVMHAQKVIWEKAATYKEVRVPWLTWGQLLAVAPGPYDLLSLDADGYNTPLLRAMPKALVDTLKVVVVEKDHPSHKPMLLDIASRWEGGWKLEHETDENVIFVKRGT